MNKIINEANQLRLKWGWGILRLSTEIDITYSTLRRGIRGVSQMDDYNLENIEV